MNAKCKRVVIRRRDGCSCRGTDVSEDYLAGGIAANGTEVGIVEGRLDGFVECGVEGWAFRGGGEVGEDWCVPRYAEAVDVEETVADCDLGFGRGFCVDGWVVREEFG
jgi:hypothetical protein